MIYRQPWSESLRGTRQSIPQTGNVGRRAKGRTASAMAYSSLGQTWLQHISRHTDPGTYSSARAAATNLLLPTGWMRVLLVFVPRQRRCTTITLRYAPMQQGNPWRLGPRRSPWVDTPGQAFKLLCACLCVAQSRRLAGCGEGGILGGWGGASHVLSQGRYLSLLAGCFCPEGWPPTSDSEVAAVQDLHWRNTLHLTSTC